MNGFGEKIKQLRKMNNESQMQLANKLNIAYQSISKWENNISMPSIEILLQISKHYKVSLDYLLDNNNDEILELDVTINNDSDFVVWTDFYCNNTIGLPSFLDKTRHRTNAINKYEAVSKNNFFIIAINENQKICYTSKYDGKSFGPSAREYYHQPNINNECFIIEDGFEIFTKNSSGLNHLKYEFVIPKKGMIIIANAKDIRLRTLWDFVLDKKYHKYYDGTSFLYNDYKSIYNEKNLFTNILYYGELDNCKFELNNNKLQITKNMNLNSDENIYEHMISEKVTQVFNDLQEHIHKLAIENKNLEKRINNIEDKNTLNSKIK